MLLFPHKNVIFVLLFPHKIVFLQCNSICISMERTIYTKLIEWKNALGRKPLMLLGARQVGKTYILKQFGSREFKNLVYVNCHNNDFAMNLFSDFDIERIVYQIGIQMEQQIVPGETLLVFDEIQEVHNGIASLKYFCENKPDLHVAVAGSLLGISLKEDESFPVGKVNTLRMYPMTFSEFLSASHREKLSEAIKELDYDTMRLLNVECVEWLRQYFFTGGMPEAVAKWIETHDPVAVRKIHHEILEAYYMDFSKHTKTEVQRIRMVWDSIPVQLAKENKKFIFGVVKKGARAAQFETAIQWLVDAGLVIKVNRCNQPRQPLKFYMDSAAFKIYLLDCGLFATLCETKPSDMLLGDNAFVEFKGAFAENYVLQQITASAQIPVYYYSKDGSTQEVDFLVQTPDRVVPLEVKAEENVKSKSLSTFVKEDFKSLNLKGLRCSMKPYIDQGWMENLPLYAVEAYFSRS